MAPVVREDAGKTQQTQMYCEAVLGTPDSLLSEGIWTSTSRKDLIVPGKAGDIESECSYLEGDCDIK